MATTAFTGNRPTPYLIIGISIAAACLLLFAIDKDTKSIRDILNDGNFIALLLYFIPAFGISVFGYRSFIRRYSYRRSIVSSLIVGIPAGFAVVVVLLVVGRELLS